MKYMKYLLFFALTAYDFVIGGCASPSDQALKKFHDVNDSLKASNNALNDTLGCEMAYMLIQQHDNGDPKLTGPADTLYAATRTASSYIELLKAQLMAADSIGDKTEPAAKLLLRTPASDSLRTMLLDVYTKAHQCFIGQDSIAQLDKVMANIGELRTRTDWTPPFFKESHTVAAITLLVWLKMECTNAANLSFFTVLHQLKKNATSRP